MPYWQLFYHIVWSTKNRAPLLTKEIEPMVHDLLRTKAVGLGVIVFALNGIEDHVHLVASIPPKIAVAKFIGQVKAVASTRFNKSLVNKTTPLYWQEEYGVFSFDSKRLPNFISYVEKQKEHHTHKTAIPVLERNDDMGVRSLHDASGLYVTDHEMWRRELEEMT